MGKWWDDSWNPIVGCSPASPGCDNCYAARQAHQMSRPECRVMKYNGLTEVAEVTPKTSPARFRPRFNGKIRAMSSDADVWTQPARWRKPRTIFVMNMGDLFHPGVDFTDVARVFRMFVEAPQHLYLLCTKRPRIAEQFVEVFRSLVDEKLKNVWLGVTVESEDQAERRISAIKRLASRFGGTFISYEPSLGPVDWAKHFEVVGNGTHGEDVELEDMKPSRLPSWIVAGGESGPEARPTHPSWIRATRDFCFHNSVRFSFKQWGRWRPTSRTGARAEEWGDGEMPLGEDGTDCRGVESLITDDTVIMRSVGKQAAGHVIDNTKYTWVPKVEEILG